MEPVISLSALYTAGKVIGTVTTLVGLPIGVIKVINWVKNKFINIDANVTSLKATMEAGLKNVSDNITSQTHIIATELKEQRQDFRTFYAPILLMQQAQAASPVAVPAKAKRTPRKKK